MSSSASTRERDPDLSTQEQGDGTDDFLTPRHIAAYGAGAALLAMIYQWPTRTLLRYLFSGTPALSLLLLVGAANDYRVLTWVPLWIILVSLHLVYSVVATSWLLYGVFATAMLPALFLVSICQFNLAGRTLRRSLRKAIVQLQFVQDTIAFFDIPALEIDTDVDGLMVVRGLTVSLSSLTIIAHGVEVGIKLTEDIELAITTERVHISLFRKIEISDCFANVKGGGADEMTFADVPSAVNGDATDGGETDDGDDAETEQPIFVEATPLLKAAAAHKPSRPKLKQSMTMEMTGGTEMQDSAAGEGWKSMLKLSPEDRDAGDKYRKVLKYIADTNTPQECRVELQRQIDSDQDVRVAICSKMQPLPTVPHPPKRSIKVTTLQNLSKPRARQTMHRLPMLLRLLLNPLAYFHPVYIDGITAGGSGQYVSHMLKKFIFKHHSQSNKSLRKLERRIMSWLVDANFIIVLDGITGLASVPFNPSSDIITQLKFGDVAVYRSLVSEVAQEEVVRLGGADATFTIPSFLLPHHEHLLPAIPTKKDKDKLFEEIEEADGQVKTLQAEKKLEQAEEDETNVQISTHVQLPAVFSQELLNFIAALVKATKVVEIEKESDLVDTKISGIKSLGKAMSQGMKDSVKKTVVDAAISDKWIAKMVGKITVLLQTAQGDVGYTGDIPVKLAPYRLPDGHPELRKILA